jgi:3-hydroxypropanoate dehydrogenase
VTATLNTAELLSLDPQAQDLLFREARTANSFTEEPVAEDQLRAIYDLIKFAPTAMNAQPLRMLVVSSPEARARLVDHMADGNKAKTASAPAVVVLAADVDFHHELPRIFPHRPGLKDAFTDETARERMARFNAGLQIGYFILGVRAAGLAAGPMTGFDAAGVDGEFFADGGRKSLVVVNIGHPADGAWVDRLPRLDFEDVATIV